MKQCSLCKQLKEQTEYNKKKATKDGFQSVCRECNKIISKTYYQANREKHLKQITIRRRQTILKNKEYVNALKKLPCTDCKLTFPPCVMDFDHLRDKNKIISKMIRSNSLEQIKLEISKCELVCANCHRIRTHARRQS